MPVAFLSQEQQRRYGRFASDPSPEQLAKYFLLDANDRELVKRCRGEHNRLGFAVQLGTVRFLGTFLTAPTQVPPSVSRFVAVQLQIAEPGTLASYAQRPATQWEHAATIQRNYGYANFSDPEVSSSLERWLTTRALVTADRPSVLFDLATAWMVRNKVLLPGVSLLDFRTS